MSSLRPADVDSCIRSLASHRGIDAHNHDGWGIAYYENKDVRLFKEAMAAGVSIAGDAQVVALVAGVPLSDQGWQPVPAETVLAIEKGRRFGINRQNCPAQYQDKP
jgi:predicted glutamine amidotransferase